MYPCIYAVDVYVYIGSAYLHTGYYNPSVRCIYVTDVYMYMIDV